MPKKQLNKSQWVRKGSRTHSLFPDNPRGHQTWKHHVERRIPKERFYWFRDVDGCEGETGTKNTDSLFRNLWILLRWYEKTTFRAKGWICWSLSQRCLCFEKSVQKQFWFVVLCENVVEVESSKMDEKGRTLFGEKKFFGESRTQKHHLQIECKVTRDISPKTSFDFSWRFNYCSLEKVDLFFGV